MRIHAIAKNVALAFILASAMFGCTQLETYTKSEESKQACRAIAMLAKAQQSVAADVIAEGPDAQRVYAQIQQVMSGLQVGCSVVVN